MKVKFPSIDPYLKADEQVINAHKDSKVGLIVPEVITKYGKANPVVILYSIGPQLVQCIYQMKKSAKDIRKNPHNENRMISEHQLSQLDRYIKSLNIDDYTFGTVDPKTIFKDKKLLYNKALILGMKMDKEKIDKAPSIETQREIFRTYLELGKAINKISNFLRQMGFDAQAGPALGGDVNYPLLAEKAGFGTMGKHGLLLHPTLGASFRLAAVYLNIENIDLTPKYDTAWLKDFCKTCNRCVKVCPASAIYKESLVHTDGSKTCIDYKKCAIPFAKDHGCTLCVKNCTLYNGNYEKIKEAHFGRL